MRWAALIAGILMILLAAAPAHARPLSQAGKQELEDGGAVTVKIERGPYAPAEIGRYVERAFDMFCDEDKGGRCDQAGDYRVTFRGEPGHTCVIEVEGPKLYAGRRAAGYAAHRFLCSAQGGVVRLADEDQPSPGIMIDESWTRRPPSDTPIPVEVFDPKKRGLRGE